MMFDDYLELGGADLARCRCITFIGPSGAGKSTYIDWLVAAHPDFAGAEHERISAGRPLHWPAPASLKAEIVLVDEVLNVHDLLAARRLLRAGHRLIVASHLPKAVHLAASPWLAAGGRARVFDLGANSQKIANALCREGYCFTPENLSAFSRRHGASFAALERVLHEWPGEDLNFGSALAHFERYCSVRTVRETLSPS